jgi:hypothetical protein
MEDLSAFQLLSFRRACWSKYIQDRVHCLKVLHVYTFLWPEAIRGGGVFALLVVFWSVCHLTPYIAHDDEKNAAPDLRAR